MGRGALASSSGRSRRALLGCSAWGRKEEEGEGRKGRREKKKREKEKGKKKNGERERERAVGGIRGGGRSRAPYGVRSVSDVHTEREKGKGEHKDED